MLIDYVEPGYYAIDYDSNGKYVANGYMSTGYMQPFYTNILNLKDIANSNYTINVQQISIAINEGIWTNSLIQKDIWTNI